MSSQDLKTQKICVHDEETPNQKAGEKDVDFVAYGIARAGRRFAGGQEHRRGCERAKHHNIVRDAELGQVDSKRRGEDSENREGGLCGEKPAKEPPEVLVGELVEEEAEGKNDGARYDPIDVIPKRSRLIEESAK